MTKETKVIKENIYTALAEVYKSVGYVLKGGQVSSRTVNYKYAGETDLISALRPHMVESGIIFYCSDINEIETRTEVKKGWYNGKETFTNQYHFSAKFSFTFQHTQSDTKIEVKSMGKGIDTGDKAEFKAMTGALKYALRQTFVIETGDDPDKVPSPEPEPLDTPQGIGDTPEGVNLPTGNPEEIKKIRERFGKAYKDIKAIATKESLKLFIDNNKDIMSNINKPDTHKEWEAHTAQAYIDKKKELGV